LRVDLLRALNFSPTNKEADCAHDIAPFIDVRPARRANVIAFLRSFVPLGRGLCTHSRRGGPLGIIVG
jgi:hypothetical protein